GGTATVAVAPAVLGPAVLGPLLAGPVETDPVGAEGVVFAAPGAIVSGLSANARPSINFRRLTGVSGNSHGTSPHGASASGTALRSVGGQMRAPPPPTRGNPPWDFEGEGACRYSKSGISKIAGSR